LISVLQVAELNLNLLKLSIMKKSMCVVLFSLSILWIACNRESNTAPVRLFTDAEIQVLKVNIEKDPLWRDYVSIMHSSIFLVTSKNLYTDEALYKHPPEIDAKLAKTNSNDEIRQVLLSSGYTEANADLKIKWLDCVKKLAKKFPEIGQVNPQRLNLNLTPPSNNEYPFNALKNSKDFLAKRNKGKQ
jgi:hypothetical protein